MSLHGFTPLVPDGKPLASEDCPECGLPTLTGPFFGGTQIMPLDAMPVKTFEQSPTQGEVVHDHRWPRPLYVEHVCPVRLDA